MGCLILITGSPPQSTSQYVSANYVAISYPVRGLKLFEG